MSGLYHWWLNILVIGKYILTEFIFQLLTENVTSRMLEFPTNRILGNLWKNTNEFFESRCFLINIESFHLCCVIIGSFCLIIQSNPFHKHFYFFVCLFCSEIMLTQLFLLQNKFQTFLQMSTWKLFSHLTRNTEIPQMKFSTYSSSSKCPVIPKEPN